MQILERSFVSFWLGVDTQDIGSGRWHLAEKRERREQALRRPSDASLHQSRSPHYRSRPAPVRLCDEPAPTFPDIEEGKIVFEIHPDQLLPAYKAMLGFFSDVRHQARVLASRNA